MIQVTPSISIHENEIQWEFVRSSGPGGQNVNKVATAVHLRFDVMGSSSLPCNVRERLILLAGKRITSEGVIIISASRFRTQERNRQDALDRLVHLIRKAAERPKPRRKTRPTISSKAERLETKKHRGEIKKLRKSVHRSDD